jgi:DNA end-binding protein Ku
VRYFENSGVVQFFGGNMKTVWKGYLRFSMVTIPVRMYSALNRRETIRFNMLHKVCGTRISQHNYCPECNKELKSEDIIRGYNYGKNDYVQVTDEEIRKARKESTETIDIMKFVDDNQISPIFYSDAHYLVPDGKAGTDAFSLFKKAIEKTNKAALAKVVIRNREHLFSIKPHDGALVAYTLHYPKEIRGLDDLEEVEKVGAVKVDEQSLSLAVQLIDNLSGDFKADEIVDEYSNALMDIINAKAEGKEYKVERKERKKVVNLMDALRQSVKETGAAPAKSTRTMETGKTAARRKKTA